MRNGRAVEGQTKGRNRYVQSPESCRPSESLSGVSSRPEEPKPQP